MSVKRNSRTVECPVDSQGVSAAREFRRNIECLKAEITDSQPRDKLNKKSMNDKIVEIFDKVIKENN